MGAFQPGLHLGHPTCSARGLGSAGSAPGCTARPGRGSSRRGSRGTEKQRPTPGQKGGARAAEAGGATPRGRAGGRQRSPGPPPQGPGAGKGTEAPARTESTTYSAVFLREEVGAVIQAFLLSPRARRTEREEGEGETQRETLAPGPRRPRARRARRARRPHRAPRVRRRREHPPSWLLRVRGSRRRTRQATPGAGRAGGAGGGA